MCLRADQSPTITYFSFLMVCGCKPLSKAGHATFHSFHTYGPTGEIHVHNNIIFTRIQDHFEWIAHFVVVDSFIMKTLPGLQITLEVSVNRDARLDGNPVNSPKRTTDDRLPAPPLCKSRTPDTNVSHTRIVCGW